MERIDPNSCKFKMKDTNWFVVSAQSIGNLYICEGTINAEQYKVC